MTVLDQILDAARWTPSGDNNQPWRFERRGVEGLRIYGTDSADHDIYDYNDGQPTLLSLGMLLESMRLAGAQHGRRLQWDFVESRGHRHLIDAWFKRGSAARADLALADQLTARSVDRRPYRLSPLSQTQKTALSGLFGPELQLSWHASWGERWQFARMIGKSTDLRLRLREAYEVHRRVLSWEDEDSPDKMPVATLGLDPLTRRTMRWLMGSYERFATFTKLFGTGLAQLEMDLIPGLCSGGYFGLSFHRPAAAPRSVPQLLVAGMQIHRFWLTATHLGLAVQPTMAPLILAHQTRRKADHLRDRGLASRGQSLADSLRKLLPQHEPEQLVFLGRIGVPRRRAGTVRSVRRSLSELCLPAAREPWRSAS